MAPPPTGSPDATERRALDDPDQLWTMQPDGAVARKIIERFDHLWASEPLSYFLKTADRATLTNGRVDDAGDGPRAVDGA